MNDLTMAATSVAVAGPKHMAHTAGQPTGLITVTVMLGMIMAIIDSTIVNVGLNDIGGNLGASVDEVSWIVTGYILANVIVMPLNGWLTILRTQGAPTPHRWCCSRWRRCCAGPPSISGWSRIASSSTAGAVQPTAQAILFETSAGTARSGDGDFGRAISPRPTRARRHRQRDLAANLHQHRSASSRSSRR